MQRVKELDSLRGLAALTIVLYHLWFDRFGILGSAVDLFFVLSGYLITTIILSNSLTAQFLVAFYIRRGLRIWPIYYLLLIVLVLLFPVLPFVGTLEDLPFYLTFTQEIARYRPLSLPTFPSAFRHTWSLAIEEQFYLFWPPLLWWLGRRGLPAVVLALVTLSAAARVSGLSAFILITHCDGLALGGLLAWLLSGAGSPVADRGRIVRLLSVIALVAMALVAATAALPDVLDRAWPAAAPLVLERTMKPLFLNLIFVALVGLTVNYAGNPRLKWLREPRLVYLGTISYGLYLYHYFIFEICKYYERALGFDPGLVWDVIKLAASIAAAVLSWQFIERPVLGIKDRFRYHGAAGPGVRGRVQGEELGAAQAG
jgi:peptidoglycan/LPS O-acetylase OafA/YrhL